jgi:hypothetical protein
MNGVERGAARALAIQIENLKDLNGHPAPLA